MANRINNLIDIKKQAIARINDRFKKKQRDKVKPHSVCNKCGCQTWEESLDGSWFCFICGNTGIWQDGSFRQWVKV